jgi:hypothetical protein
LIIYLFEGGALCLNVSHFAKKKLLGATLMATIYSALSLGDRCLFCLKTAEFASASLAERKISAFYVNEYLSGM